MGSIGALFALFVAGYILGVWTACFVLRQGQTAYEDGPKQPQRRRAEAGRVEITL